jgi:ATP-dependent Lon protease
VGHRRGWVDEPAVLLDEIDKVGLDYRGDPSALLESLTRHHTFAILDLDLTCPMVSGDGQRDRTSRRRCGPMELVQIDGYTSDDKVAIARDSAAAAAGVRH